MQKLRIDRDYEAMKRVLACLYTLSYSDACDALEKRLTEIRKEDD